MKKIVLATRRVRFFQLRCTKWYFAGEKISHNAVDEMILFTSSESFKIFGKKKLKDIYENSFDGKSDFKMIKIIKVNEKIRL